MKTKLNARVTAARELAGNRLQACMKKFAGQQWMRTYICVQKQEESTCQMHTEMLGHTHT